jgi:hypothetical protein
MADPALANVSPRDQFSTAFPLSVDTTRPRRVKGAVTPVPINVLTLRGTTPSPVEIELRLPGGSLLAHWPPAQMRNGRLRWLDYQLAVAAPEGAARAAVAADHWFLRARQDKGALALVKGTRAEEFCAYDFEAALPVPLSIEGGPDVYDLRSTAGYALQDVVVVAPSEKGRRIGWLDSLPAAHDKQPLAAAQPAAENGADEAPNQPRAVAVARAVGQVVVVNGRARAVVNAVPAAQPAAAPAAATNLPAGPAVPVTLSAPLATDSDELRTASQTKLAERLTAAGLAPAEVELMLSIYGPALFGSDKLVVAWRLPASVVDELNPLVIDPEPTRSVRVVMVIGRNLDPQIGVDLQKFVAQLGSADYKQREAAEARLAELGSLAFPALRKALANSDPEIAFRAERLLLDQQQPIDAPAGPQ